MPPSDFQEARTAAGATSSSGGGAPSTLYYCAQVDGRPYLPNLRVSADTDDAAATTAGGDADGDGASSYPAHADDLKLSVARAAVAVILGASQTSDSAAVYISSATEEELRNKLTVKVVSGGITNSLYRVSGLRELGVFAKEEAEEDNKIDESVLVRVFGEFWTKL